MTPIPCHFCGSPDTSPISTGHMIAVTCDNCDASSPGYDDRHVYGGMTARTAAIVSHNEMRRVEA